MRDRDLRSLQEWRRELAEEEASEREKQERPIREAEEKLQAAHRELIKIERERLLGQTDDPYIKRKIGDKPFRDPLAWDGVDPQNLEKWPHEYAVAYNAESIRLYLNDYPERKYLFDNKEFLERLGAYFDRNKISITNGMDIKRTVDRFIAAGLAPEPEPISEFVPELYQPPAVEPAQPSEPEYEVGWDVLTGQRRTYSRFEIDRMSAEEYLRCFRLSRKEMLDAMRDR